MKALIAIVILITTVIAFSEAPPDPKVLKEALGQTQALLNDPAQRGEVIKNDPKAAAADAQLQNLMSSPALTNESYALAGEILEILMSNNAGDPDAMQRALEAGQRDPAAFLQSLPEAQRRKIQEIAKKIEAGKKTVH